MAQPDLIPAPFAENATPGTIEPIPPLTPSVPQQATWSSGFPQVTMQPLAAGGIPPRGQDFNGVLNALSQHIFHMQGGGQYKWSDDHGPYSIGDVLQSDDGLRSYVSVVDNNTDNFNTNPAAIGVSWLPWSGGAASELIAGLLKIATTAQAQAGTNDASAMTPAKTGILFPFRGIQVYDTAGTYTWNVPDGVSKVWVTVVGGGASGGSAGVANARGSGGGPGGCVIGLVDLNGVNSVIVTVGSGGPAVGSSPGLPGETSSFGSFCSATGGEGGNAGQAGNFAGGAPGHGIASSGDMIVIRGGYGSDGNPTTYNGGTGMGGGNGGASYFGGGRRGTTGTGAGTLGTAPGSGGGGSSNAEPSSAGNPGIVIIQW